MKLPHTLHQEQHPQADLGLGNPHLPALTGINPSMAEQGSAGEDKESSSAWQLLLSPPAPAPVRRAARGASRLA